jgi:hypothetical protein
MSRHFKRVMDDILSFFLIFLYFSALRSGWVRNGVKQKIETNIFTDCTGVVAIL